MADDTKTADPRNQVPWPLERGQYSHRLRLRLPSTPGALDRGVDRAMRLMVRSGCPEHARVDLEIALREALANAIHHGNNCTKGKRVFLRCYASPHTGSLILVRDEGCGFDPGGVPDPRGADRLGLDHGRGLFLMRALMDHVEYRKGGCEVLLFKAYTPNGVGD